MEMSRRKGNVLAFVFISIAVMVLVGSTLAILRNTVSTFAPVQIGKIALSADSGFDTSITLRDVIPGDKIAERVTFSKDADSEAMYVRAKVYLTTEDDTIKSDIAKINTYPLGVTSEQAEYQWKRIGNFYYLMADDNTLYDVTTNEEIVIFDEIRLPLMPEEDQDISLYSKTASLNLELRAIQSLGVEYASFTEADILFGENFGEIALANPALYDIKSGTLRGFSALGEGTKEIIIPNTYSLDESGNAVYGTDYKVTKIGVNAFRNNKTTTSVHIAKNIEIIDDYAFYSNSNITSFTFEEGSNLYEIGTYGLAYCSKIPSLILPEGLIMLEDYVINNMSNLRNIRVPNTLLEVGTKAITINNSYATLDKNGYYLGNETNPYLLLNGVKDTSCTTFEFAEGVQIINGYVFQSCASLLTIEIPASVTSLSGYALYKSSNPFTSITFEERSELRYLGYRAFNYADIQELILPNNSMIFEYGVFFGCDQLVNLQLSDKIIRFGDNVFYNCNALQYYNIDGVNYLGNDFNQKVIMCEVADKTITEYAIPDTVCVLYRTFYNCNKLINVTIPNNVVSIGSYAFYNCSSLTSITIPEGVTSIGIYAFQSCSSLTGIAIPEGVTSIGSYTFYECSSLTSINIPVGATSIGERAFSSCSSLTSIAIPSSVRSIGSYAFAYCAKNLKQIIVDENNQYFEDIDNKLLIDIVNKRVILGTNNETIIIPEGVTNIGYSAFRYCSSLTSITIPESVTSIGGEAFYGCSGLTSVTIPEGVTSIISNTFSGCSSLTSITIPDSVTSIGERAFSSCSSLTSITIPEGVTSIGDSAFSGCRSLTSITIPEGVTSIGDREFQYCSSLTSITIPEGVTSIGASAFSGCSSLTSITIPTGVISIGSQAFYACSSLTFIKIPDGVESMGDQAFFNCSSLSYIILPNSFTSIGSSAFSGCRSLLNITIPNSVTSIKSHAFWDCSSLKNIVIPSTITNIPNSAFSGCSSLTNITIPSTLSSIGSWAFYRCYRLVNVYYLGSESDWSGININSSGNTDLTNANRYYITFDDGEVDVQYLAKGASEAVEYSDFEVVYSSSDTAIANVNSATGEVTFASGLEDGTEVEIIATITINGEVVENSYTAIYSAV